MKNFKIICISVLLLGLMAGPAIAQISYSKDILEPGNPPGGTCDIIGGACETDLDCAGGALKCLNPTLKTWDETWELAVGETMDMDIWVTDVPEPAGLLTGGFFITYDPAIITITDVVPNDSNTGGQFDGGATQSFEPAAGQWLVALVQFSCVPPDADGDVFMGRVTFQSLADGQVDITISTIPDFDTVVGCEGARFDPDIAPNTVIVNETVGCDPPDCDDGNPCTVDVCNEDSPICVNTPDDSLCDDGDVCTGVETCDAVSGCQAGTPLECDDGLYCNGVETCDAVSGCQAGTPPDCDDGVDCTVDTCDEIGDSCANTPDDLFCDNGDVCDGAETCDPIDGCQTGDPLVCEDGDLCTTDSCDPATGCTFTPVDCGDLICDPATGECIPIPCTDDEFCDDGIYCNGAETCDLGSGLCQSGTPPDCDDGVSCTDDMCDIGLDACVNTPNDESCDDADVCTGVETCDPVSDCQPGDPLVCDDGNLCTNDSCDPVAGCMYTPVECPPGESCDPADGLCKGGCDPELCDDGLYCNGTETCVDGVCTPGTAPDCDDGVDCTDDICDEDIDACVNTPNDGTCDDADVCNGSETCDPIDGCQPGDPLICEDGDLCTTDSCDPATGCIFTPVECPPGESCDPADGLCKAGCDPESCDDGLFCNGTETCVDDVCTPGTPPDCDDGVECTTDVCDEDIDACVNNPNDGAL